MKKTVTAVMLAATVFLAAPPTQAEEINYRELARILSQSPDFRVEWERLQKQENVQKDWLTDSLQQTQQPAATPQKINDVTVYLSFNCGYCDEFWRLFAPQIDAIPAKVNVRLLTNGEASVRIAFVYRRLTERDPQLANKFLSDIFANKTAATGDTCAVFIDRWLRSNTGKSAAEYMDAMELREREIVQSWREDFRKLPREEQKTPLVLVDGKPLAQKDILEMGGK